MIGLCRQACQTLNFNHQCNQHFNQYMIFFIALLLFSFIQGLDAIIKFYNEIRSYIDTIFYQLFHAVL